MSTPQQFLLACDQWHEKAKAAPLLVIRETIQEINNEIIANTPVDTGFLRASYFASVGALPSGEGGAGSAAAVNGLAATLQPGQTYYMGNVARYARRLEYGFVGTDSLGRTYNQRGRFFMSSVLARAAAIANAVAARVGARL